MSADSILAMFRNFNTTMAMTEMGNYLSASTTPSCSSLQDEIMGSEDESLMSNAAHSPGGGGKESPTRYRYSNVIQVRVGVNGEMPAMCFEQNYIKKNLT